MHTVQQPKIGIQHYNRLRLYSFGFQYVDRCIGHSYWVRRREHRIKFDGSARPYRNYSNHMGLVNRDTIYNITTIGYSFLDIETIILTMLNDVDSPADCLRSQRQNSFPYLLACIQFDLLRRLDMSQY